MKISVIMIDGGFRENIYSAEYFAKQNFPENEYEVIWIEYFDKAHERLRVLDNVKVITLNRNDEYHSSYCFNKGIEEAKGELLVLPDADQIVKSDFLQNIWEKHLKCDNLVSYMYRYDEKEKNSLDDHSFTELDKKCILKNTLNYGGCLAVRKKWLIEINGYEMHPIFRSGFHANGLDIYTRLKNIGLAIQWDRELKLYHPWHPSTLADAPQYEPQKKLIEYRKNNLQYMAIEGIDKNKNILKTKTRQIADQFDSAQPKNNTKKEEKKQKSTILSLIEKIIGKFK